MKSVYASYPAESVNVRFPPDILYLYYTTFYQQGQASSADRRKFRPSLPGITSPFAAHAVKKRNRGMDDAPGRVPNVHHGQASSECYIEFYPAVPPCQGGGMQRFLSCAITASFSTVPDKLSHRRHFIKLHAHFCNPT